MSRTAIAILSTENLLHNLKTIKAKLKETKVIAMLNANAYGHGLRSVASRLDGLVDMIGVTCINDALALRENGIKTDILLTEGVFEPIELLTAATENLHVVFHNQKQIEWLDKSSLPLPLNTWMKIRVGSNHMLGFGLQAAHQKYKHLNNHTQTKKPIRVISDFEFSDKIEQPFNKQQNENFLYFRQGLENEFSLCNSAEIFHFPDCYYDYVRAGLALYGISQISGKTAAELGLKPVMTLKSSLMSVQKFNKGDSIGYGAHYTCADDMTVGIVAFGYGDGYPYIKKNGSFVLVNNKICPLVGRISMDMMAVDLCACPQAKIGDSVLIWGAELPIESITGYENLLSCKTIAGVQSRVKFMWISS